MLLFILVIFHFVIKRVSYPPLKNALREGVSGSSPKVVAALQSMFGAQRWFS